MSKVENMSLEKLLKMSDRCFEEIKSFDESSTMKVKDLSAEMITFNKFFYTQFDTLKSVKILLIETKYKEGFILLRSVFEGYLFLLQMIKGKDYLFTREFTVIPNPGNNNPKARDDTLNKWNEDLKHKKISEHDKIISINPKQNDKIAITYRFEGLFEKSDIHQTGYWISRYFFAFESYDPEIKFLLDLPSIQNITLYSDDVNNLKNIHTEIYHHVFFFDNIIKNLHRNKLVDNFQKDRITVHYCFLSSFTHPTRRIIQEFGNPINKYLKKTIDEVIEELIMIYIVKLQSLFIELMLDYYNELLTEKDCMTKYHLLVKDMKQCSNYFWFIFDEPTEYDKAISEQEKKVLKRIRPETYDGIKDITIYYGNPLERLKNMKSVGFC